MRAKCTLLSILRGISLCLAFHAITQPRSLLAQTRVTGSVADDAGGPPPRATLVLRHIPDLPKPKLRETPRLPSIPSFEKIAQIAQGVRAFSVDDVPDGLLHVCAYPEDIAYISNCEFTEPSDTYYKVSKGSLNRPLAIALRRGTIVEIVVSDPRGLISESSGFHFNPALISTQGQIKPARFRSKLGSDLTYLASLPVGTAAKLLVDTRLQVLGADGKRLERLNPSAIEIRGGQPFVRVTLQVTTIDLDLRPITSRR